MNDNVEPEEKKQCDDVLNHTLCLRIYGRMKENGIKENNSNSNVEKGGNICWVVNYVSLSIPGLIWIYWDGGKWKIENNKNNENKE